MICLTWCKEQSIPDVKIGQMVYEMWLLEKENIQLRINQHNTADVYVISYFE